MTVTTDFNTFANRYHEQNNTLGKLPTNLIFKILGDRKKIVQDAHKKNMTQCLKEMNEKYRGNLHIWFVGPDDDDPDEERGMMVPDVWYSEQHTTIWDIEHKYDTEIFSVRLWETDEDRTDWDASDICDCEDDEVGFTDSKTNGTVWFYDHVAGGRNSEWTSRLW